MATFKYNPHEGDVFHDTKKDRLIKILSVGPKSIKAIGIDKVSMEPIGASFTIFFSQWDNYVPAGSKEGTKQEDSDSSSSSTTANKFVFDIDEDGNLTITTKDGKVIKRLNVRGPGVNREKMVCLGKMVRMVNLVKMAQRANLVRKAHPARMDGTGLQAKMVLRARMVPLVKLSAL